MFCFYENWELYIHVILLQVINYEQLHVFVLLHTPTSKIIILIFHNKHYLGALQFLWGFVGNASAYLYHESHEEDLLTGPNVFMNY